MVAMKSMRRTAAEKKASDDGSGMPGNGSARDGVEVRLEHEHIKKLGMDGPLPSGTGVEFGGKGEVADSGTHVGSDGEPRHHMTLIVHRAGVEADQTPVEKSADLRGEITKNTNASESKAADRDANRMASRTRSDKAIPETKDSGKVQMAAART
jgi:hypothetical protein